MHTETKSYGLYLPSPSQRTVPQALEAEQSVLGACLQDKESVWTAVDLLEPSDFFTDRHQTIFEAIVEMNTKGLAVDLVTVAEHLKQKGKLDYVGGSTYLSQLMGVVATSANTEPYCLIVRERSISREVIERMTGVIQTAYGEHDAFNLLDEAEGEVMAIRRRTEGGASTGKLPVKDTLRYLESIQGIAGGITGVPSGLKRLDDLTAGFQPSDYIVIAARPSMGKTALMLTLARNAAMNDAPAAIFSMEMPTKQLVERMLSTEARIDSQRMRTGRMTDDDWKRLAAAAGRLDALPIYIDDTPGLTPQKLRARARRLVRDQGVKIIMVDYIQLMRVAGAKPNREQEIAEISRGIKDLAKELNIPVVALSQLSRAVETRGGDKRPELSDLRESGSIEQDCDVAAFLYRAERYGIRIDESGNTTDNMAEILVKKQRNGPIGDVSVSFVKRYGAFENLTLRADTEAPKPYVEKDPF